MASTLHDTAKSGTDNSSGTSTPTADTLAVTANDVIWVICKWEGATAGATASVSDGVDTYTAATAQIDHTNNDLHMQCFWTKATTTGTRTITFTLSSARGFRRCAAASFTPSAGITSWALGNTVSSTLGNSNASPTAGTTTGGPGVAVVGFGMYGDRDLTAGTGWTVPAELDNTMACGEYQFPTAASTSLTGDGSFSAGVEWLAQLVFLNEVSSGGSAGVVENVIWMM